MDTNSTIGKVRRFGGYTGKMIVVGVLVLICWIGSLLVLGVVSEREGRQAEVGREVAEAWGRPQLVSGPVVAVPFTRHERAGSGMANARYMLYVLPQDLKIDTTLKPELRSRGIFSAPVYRTDLSFSGSFKEPNFAELGIAPSSLLWNEAVLVVGLSDTRSIQSGEGATWNALPISFAPGASAWSVNGMGVHAPLPNSGWTPWTLAPSEQKFSFSLSFAGSKGLSFLPVGDRTVVNAQAPWGAPSFVGAYLPTTEKLGQKDFSASWEVSSLGRSYPSAWEGTGSGVRLVSDDFGYGGFFGGDLETKPLHISAGSGEGYEQALAASAFGVNLFREVTFYTLVSRTVKYAILFIALTFLAFYLFEIIAGLRVHPFQYLLIGGGLVIFYLLLLSFSEHIGFGWAYLLSAFMTLGLITSYSAGVLKVHKRAWQIAVILAVLYAYLYAVLQLESYALLFGTLFLFIALATVMRATRKIEWYKDGE